MEDVVIVSAARTPVGAFNGAFATLSAHKLGESRHQGGAGARQGSGEDVSEVILGQVLTAAQGQNPARQASIAAGIPIATPAWGINMVCGSGLRTVALGAQAIREGDSRIVVAGGQESMSLSTHAAYLRAGQKMGDISFIDTMIRDGLWDAFNGYHMGMTAENVAKEWQITREEQDRFAVASQNKAEAARKAGKFKDEIDARHHQGPARATRWWKATNISATARPMRRWRACDPPSTRKAASPPAMPRASMTALPRWC